MKKYVLIASLCALGCSDRSVRKDRLIGTWEMTNVVTSSGTDVTDRTTFFPNDSVSMEVYRDGVFQKRYPLSYKLNTDLYTIALFDAGKPERKFKIVRLTETELHWKDPITGTVVKNKRIK
ncbi:MAG TPA: lipocalin family protein [Flavobacterium sp.]|nr:lipocalin family protein [Flavobacterium sp.]